MDKAYTNTVDSQEISRFSKDASSWWDEDGPFSPLHRMNPIRMQYLKSVICRHYHKNERDLRALTGLSVLDAGCGGGVVCEPLARLGADVTGIDADSVAIGVADDHATHAGLAIDYRMATTRDLLDAHSRKFDVVLVLEVAEHVASLQSFADECSALCKPGGLIIFSTLNKTMKSLALAKIAAEYILRWVPSGTHDWQKFIRPSTLASALRASGATPFETMGLVYRPLEKDFFLSRSDLDINYFMSAIRNEL